MFNTTGTSLLFSGAKNTLAHYSKGVLAHDQNIGKASAGKLRIRFKRMGEMESADLCNAV